MLLFLLISLNSFSKTPVDLDFIKHEWKHIIKWECNTLSKDGTECLKACTHLKENQERSCLGIDSRANPKFYSDLIDNYVTAKPNFLGQVCSEPVLTKIKRLYFKKYFSPFSNLNKCIRLGVFDIGVLSGIRTAKRYLNRGLATGLKGKDLRDYILDDYSENHLKKIKFKAGRLKGTYMYKFYGGWFNRIDSGKKLSEKYCH